MLYFHCVRPATNLGELLYMYLDALEGDEGAVLSQECLDAR